MQDNNLKSKAFSLRTAGFNKGQIKRKLGLNDRQISAIFALPKTRGVKRGPYKNAKQKTNVVVVKFGAPEVITYQGETYQLIKKAA